MKRYEKYFIEETPAGETTTHYFYADRGWIQGDTYPSLNASLAPVQASIKQITHSDEDLVLAYTYQENIGKGFVHWVDPALSKMIKPKIFRNQPISYGDISSQVKEFPKRMRHLIFKTG